IRDIINANRKNEKKFRVLDVGGRWNLMRRFLPDDVVFYLDPYVDSKDNNYIKGDGCSMPLDDSSFDWVVSSDVFEHIPKDKRETFINEKIRVAKLGVILAAPFFSKEVAEAEKKANESYKILSGGKDHIWLKEHIKNGLPDEKSLEKIIFSKNLSFQKIHNNRLFIWEVMMGIGLLASKNLSEEMTRELEKFNFFYNSKVYPFDFSSPSYRKIYFIKKDKKLKELAIKDIPIEDSLFLEALGEGINLVNKIDREKGKAVVSKDYEINKLRITADKWEKEIERLNKSVVLKDEIIKIEKEINARTERRLKLEGDELRNIERDIQNMRLEIQQRDTQIKERDTQIRQRDQEINFIKSSKFWKARKLYLRIKNFRPRNFFELAEKGVIALKKEGLRKFFWYLYKYILHGRGYFRKPGEQTETLNLSEYEVWIQKNEKWDRIKIEKEMEKFEYKPKISIVLPVFDADEIFLRKTVFSVINQYYQNWELCVVDNASTKIIVKKILAQFEKRDSRIRVEFFEKKEDLSRVINRAAEMATGEFIGFLGQNDGLAPNALFENAKSINENSDLDLVYSDEDQINENELRFGHNFKPDWSPELVLSQGYVGNFLIVRREAFKRAGGFREGFKSAETYDFLLRLSEIVEKPFHVPKILYHKRIFPWQEKDFSNIENGKRALERALKRRMIKGKAEIPDFAVEKNLPNYKIEFSPDDYEEKVTIIIPTKDKVDLLKRCIESIKEKTDYKNYDILVVDNNSKEKKTFDFLDKEKIRYVSIPTKEFNYSKIHNLAVKNIETELILLLNNDTEVISSEWLTAMVGTLIMDKKIGAVGARLIYGDKTIQHSGVIVGPHSTADHANKNMHFEEGGYQNYNLVMRNYSAVTAACMLTKKSLFEKVGGFDERNMAVAFNDVDYCLKLLKSGYRIVYNPDVLLYHHESRSRGKNDNLKEPRYFTQKWKKVIERDPFGNANLSLENTRFELKKN
ncbi:MAG: glycosyltransferase, partial [Candidatus Moranbacteria bacterium]|nr:glycosyltransferase [Candidatus Moranbacteria bacterium]